MRTLAIAVTVMLGGGCLPRALAVDTEAVQVTWTFDETDFECYDGSPVLPEVRIRSRLQVAGADEDDEVFDLRPCFDPHGVGDDQMKPFSAVCRPRELGAYDFSIGLWDRFGGTVLGRSENDGFVILNTPGDRSAPVSFVIAPVSAP